MSYHIYPEQQGLAPYWAAQGDGVAGNYYHPTKALGKQYDFMNKGRGGALPDGRTFSINDLPAQTGDLLNYYNVDYKGEIRHRTPAPIGVTVPIPGPGSYPWHTGLPTGPIVAQPMITQQQYGAGIDGVIGVFNDLWMSLKIAFLKFFAWLGLYKGMIPTHPKAAVQAVADTGSTQSTPVQTQFTAAPKTVKYESPFDKHTVIFSRQVIA